MNNTTLNFESIYKQMYYKVLQFVSSKITNYETARDIVGDIFEKVHSKQNLFNPEKSSASTWVWNITKNHLTDYYRLRKLDAIQISKLIDDEGHEMEFAGSMDTFQTVSTNDQMAIIMDAINTLPSNYKQIAKLVLVKDLKLTDVVAKTGKPLNTVKVMAMRVKEMLSEKLQSLA